MPIVDLPVDIAVRGTHKLHVYGATWPDEAVDFEGWTLTYTDPGLASIYGEPPKVVAVTLSESNTQATLDLDIGTIPDISYTLDGPDFDGGNTVQATAFTGIRTSVPARGDQAGVLLDIDAPLLRPDGYALTDAGDRRLSGGLATVRKAIWHQLLKDDAPIRWKEARPGALRDEERRLQRVVEAVPYVREAHVLLTFDDDHAIINVKARTDFGELDTSKAAG